MKKHEIVELLELTQDRIKEVMHYDPETGEFSWLKSSGTMKKGSRAGADHHEGYRKIKLNRITYQAHRLAWLYVHGCWPREHVDHINGDKGDNRICNLREATMAQNKQNSHRPNSNNKIGLLGVSKSGERFHAKITKFAKCIHIGSFDTAEQAHEAYLSAKRQMHPFGVL